MLPVLLSTQRVAMSVTHCHRFVLLWALMLGALGARADWQELLKEDEVAYYFDRESVMPVHVSRYAWTLVDQPNKNEKAPNGETYKSAMVRWRLYCKSDTVVAMAVSFFDQPMGKGREVARDEVREWRVRESPIRPNTYLAALKKEICGPRQAAG